MPPKRTIPAATRYFIYPEMGGKREPGVHKFNDNKDPDQPEDKKNFKVNLLGKEHKSADDHKPDEHDNGGKNLFFHLIYT